MDGPGSWSLVLAAGSSEAGPYQVGQLHGGPDGRLLSCLEGRGVRDGAYTSLDLEVPLALIL